MACDDKPEPDPPVDDSDDEDAELDAQAAEMRRLFGDGPMELWGFPS